MHAEEFVLLFLWVLAPPLFVGLVLLGLLAGAAASSTKRHLPASLLLALLAGLVGVLLFAFAPPWLGHYIGMQDIEVFGVTTMWAPFAFVAVALAFPFAAWILRRGVKQ